VPPLGFIRVEPLHAPETPITRFGAGQSRLGSCRPCIFVQKDAVKYMRCSMGGHECYCRIHSSGLRHAACRNRRGQRYQPVRKIRAGGGVQAAAQPSPVRLQSYTMAHAMRGAPPELLGGPLTVKVSQESGSTRFVLPGPRVLDAAVFGTPSRPAGFEETAPFPLLGVPIDLRMTHNGAYTITKHATPFPNWYEVGSGSVHMTVVDATAIDGARTKDKIDFEATFKLPDGAR